MSLIANMNIWKYSTQFFEVKSYSKTNTHLQPHCIKLQGL